MTQVAKADITAGCTMCTSIVNKCEDIVFVVTAPNAVDDDMAVHSCPIPHYDPDTAFEFVKKHGMAVRSIGAGHPCD